MGFGSDPNGHFGHRNQRSRTGAACGSGSGEGLWGRLAGLRDRAGKKVGGGSEASQRIDPEISGWQIHIASRSKADWANVGH